MCRNILPRHNAHNRRHIRVHIVQSIHLLSRCKAVKYLSTYWKRDDGHPVRCCTRLQQRAAGRCKAVEQQHPNYRPELRPEARKGGRKAGCARYSTADMFVSYEAAQAVNWGGTTGLTRPLCPFGRRGRFCFIGGSYDFCIYFRKTIPAAAGNDLEIFWTILYSGAENIRLKLIQDLYLL